MRSCSDAQRAHPTQRLHRKKEKVKMKVSKSGKVTIADQKSGRK